jgi:alpha-beta hydrolase superfamily lysophospholipase
MFRAENTVKNETGGEVPTWRAGAAALPVTFGRSVGLFTPPETDVAPSDTAVLFLSPWGFEEMCTRKLWRLMAEKLAPLGIPSLRFDYPGTGDALDALDGESLDTWSEAASEGADLLRRLSGARRLLLVGHGLGATLAATLGKALQCEAAVLMAPVVSGRFYLRELSAWSKMVDEGLGLRAEQRISEGVAVAGLVMPEKVAAAVRSLTIERLESLPCQTILVVERAGRDKEAALSAHLAALGADVARMDYAGYDALVSNPTVACQPAEVIEGVTAWIAQFAGEGKAAHVLSPTTGPALLEGDGFVEEPLRFGEGDRLFGTLCQPSGSRRGATLLLFGTAYDRQAGWARSTTETARHLARNDVASFRFDAANVGDSPQLTGAPEQVQYSDSQLADARGAMDLLTSRGLGPVLSAGRCSGAYLAFRAAVADSRVAGVVPVNAYTFRWDPALSVDEALRTNPRSLGDYRQRALNPETFRRLLTGGIDLRRAIGNVLLQVARRLVALAPGLFGRFTRSGRLNAATHADFRLLAERKVPVVLLFSEDDVGLERLHLAFGRRGLRPYANLSVDTIPDADHNLSPPHAQAAYRKLLLEMALKIG